MILTKTPYRISFFGGGTDYPAWFDNFGGGSVLSTTIDKYCYISCRYLPPFFKEKSRIVWSKIELVNNPGEIEHPAVREALKLFGIGEGMEIHHYGDLPHRAGMGSSSSFAVGLLNALNLLQNKEITKKDLALNAIQLEQDKIGESVGCQDQVAAAYGGFNRINFGGPDRFSVHPVPISPENKELLEKKLMIFYTGLSRTASEIAAKQIESTSRKEKELRQMLSFVGDAEKILSGPPQGMDAFGSLLHETWMLKRGLTQAISNSYIDELYNRARKAGALGGKLLGAGGGGFLLLYAKEEDQGKVRKALADLLYVPFHFEDGGSQMVFKNEV